jgi:hypothetical protein
MFFILGNLRLIRISCVIVFRYFPGPYCRLHVNSRFSFFPFIFFSTKAVSFFSQFSVPTKTNKFKFSFQNLKITQSIT